VDITGVQDIEKLKIVVHRGVIEVLAGAAVDKHITVISRGGHWLRIFQRMN